MAEMTLKVKMTGIQSLLTQLKNVNTQLKLLNKNFNTLATTVGNVANNLQQVNQAVRSASRATGSTSGGGSGKNKVITPGPPPAQPPPTPGSYYKQVFGNNKVGNFLSSNAYKFPPFMNSAVKSIAKLLPIIAVITAMLVIYVKVMQQVIEVLKTIVSLNRSLSGLYYATGGNNKNSAALRGVGNALGMSNEEVGAEASRFPGMGEQLIQYIKMLRNMSSDQEAARFAQQMGLQKWTGVRDMDKDTFNRLINSPDIQGSNKGAAAAAQMLSIAFSELMNEIKDVIGSLAIYTYGLVQLIDATKIAVKAIHYLNPVVAIADLINGIIKAVREKLGLKDDTAKKLNQAASNLNQAANQFTNKTGVVGGGEKANRANLKGWSWYENQQRLINMGTNLGAFEF